MKQRLIEYGIPVFLALSITVLIILLVPALTIRYQLKEEGSVITDRVHYQRFEDLDGDGSSEIVYLHLNSAGDFSVTVNTIKDFTINQFNLRGELLTLGQEMDFQDIDRDGIQDIIVCTQENDSVFLSIIDDIHRKPTHHHELFIEKIGQLNDRGDYLFIPGGCSDLNGDGHLEYLFVINGGYSLQPRRVYAVDLARDTIFCSPPSGAGILGLSISDLDGDNRGEILLKTAAPYNFKQPVPYHDSVSWLMVLDDDLQYYRPPSVIHPAPSWVELKSFEMEGESYILALTRHHRTMGYTSHLMLMNSSLDVLGTRIWGAEEKRPVDLWQVPGSTGLNDIKLIINNGLYTLNPDLEVIDSVFNDHTFNDAYQLRMLDLESDGDPEYVGWDAGNLVIFSNEYRELIAVPLQWSRERPQMLVSLRKEPGIYPSLVVQAGPVTGFFQFRENPFFVFRFLVYALVFFSFFGVFYLLVKLQSRIISRRYKRERLIGQLQLQSIKNQLDPHFTYNALNAVGSLIYKGEKELAYRYLKGLTDLLRMVSADPSRVTWTLSDELEFVHKYLEIEKLRFRERFLYSVEVEEGTISASPPGEYQVPKLSILTFVENAIKHGLRHKEKNRWLDIKASRANGGIRITIRDNGIGRVAAARLADKGNGSGLELMEHYFRQFTEANGKMAWFEVKDLIGENLEAAGTLVEITIT